MRKLKNRYKDLFAAIGSPAEWISDELITGFCCIKAPLSNLLFLFDVICPCL